MIHLSRETEALALRLAAAQRVSAEEVIRRALESQAGSAVGEARPRRRLSLAQMLAVGAEIAALPLLDARTPAEIMDDLNTP